jgi:DegV family protein with EDD domain
MIGIITDSTCDIPDDLIAQYGIIVVPQIVVWGNQQYRDHIDITPNEFYQRLSQESEYPHSSMPSVPDFQQAFQRARDAGADELVILTVSSAMSGTYTVAKNAAESLNIPFALVDSKGPTMTLGWQVLAAARAREAGADLDSIVNQVEQVRGRLVQYVAMVTMEYLQKGGRIGNAAKWAGTLLKIKPLVSINHSSGLVEPSGLYRTQKALVDGLYTKFFDHLKGGKNLRIAVLHGDDPEAGQALAERVRAEFHPIELIINTTGPVLGINTGPGALALCGYAED